MKSPIFASFTLARLLRAAALIVLVVALTFAVVRALSGAFGRFTRWRASRAGPGEAQ